MNHVNLFFGHEANESWHLFLKRDLSLPLFVENIGETDECPQYCVERDETSSLIIVEWIISGEGTLNINGTSYHLKQNDIYIIPPHIAHKYYSSKDNPMKKVWINFESEMFAKVIEEFGLDKIIVFEDEAKFGKIFFDQVLAVSKLSNYSDDICFQICDLAFSLFRELAMQQYYKSKGNISTIAQRIKRVLDDSIGSSISLDEIANDLHYSKKQIARTFTQNYKITPHQYLIQEKMKAAKIYLEHTKLSIKEISNLLGFDSQHYFSNCFKKYNGYSPIAYKKKLFKEEN